MTIQFSPQSIKTCKYVQILNTASLLTPQRSRTFFSEFSYFRLLSYNTDTVDCYKSIRFSYHFPVPKQLFICKICHVIKSIIIDLIIIDCIIKVVLISVTRDWCLIWHWLLRKKKKTTKKLCLPPNGWCDLITSCKTLNTSVCLNDSKHPVSAFA